MGKKKVEKMIENGVTKVKGMAELKKEYNFPAAELSDMWVECKENLSTGSKKKGEEKVSNLVVVDISRKIQGKYGIYYKDNTGVQLEQGTSFKTKDEVIEEKTKKLFMIWI